jgi:hypothetical protein
MNWQNRAATGPEVNEFVASWLDELSATFPSRPKAGG